MSYLRDRFQQLKRELDSYVHSIQWENFHHLRLKKRKAEEWTCLTQQIWRGMESFESLRSIDEIIDIIDGLRGTILCDVSVGEMQNGDEEMGLEPAECLLLEHFQMLLLAKCAIQVYIHVFGNLLGSTFPLSRDVIYWNSIRRSFFWTLIHVAQVLPLHLVSTSRHLLQMRSVVEMKMFLSKWNLIVETQRWMGKNTRYLKHTMEVQAICLGILSSFPETPLNRVVDPQTLNAANLLETSHLRSKDQLVEFVSHLSGLMNDVVRNQLRPGNDLWDWNEKRKKLM